MRIAAVLLALLAVVLIVAGCAAPEPEPTDDVTGPDTAGEPASAGDQAAADAGELGDELDDVSENLEDDSQELNDIENMLGEI